MSRPQDEDLAASLPIQTNFWIRELIMLRSAMHDLAGPVITNLSEAQFIAIIQPEIRRRLLAATAGREVAIPLRLVESIAKVVGKDVYSIRQLKEAYRKGEISLSDLKRLPGYVAFPEYFEGDPELLERAMLEAAQERQRLCMELHKKFQADRPEQTERVSPLCGDELVWMETQIMGMATTEDLWEPACSTGSKEKIICEYTMRFSEEVLWGIYTGHLQHPVSHVRALAARMARETYEIRSMKEAFLKNLLCRKDLEQTSYYSSYRCYFEEDSKFSTVIKNVSALGKNLFAGERNRTN